MISPRVAFGCAAARIHSYSLTLQTAEQSQAILCYGMGGSMHTTRVHFRKWSQIGNKAVD